MKNLYYLLAFFCCTACKHIDVYEKTVPFPRHEWDSSVKPSFTFTIEDTASRYNIFVVLRHQDAYHFNNLWLDITTVAPGDTAQTLKANLKLGDNKRWLGNSIDNIIEHRILININPVKLKVGTQKFILSQVMREDPLRDILNIGLQIEKVKL